jgi:hypothetical protein
MRIYHSTTEYETWLGKQLEINSADLQQKHKNMAVDPFVFLRATYYRWAQSWSEVCSQLAGAPGVLAVADLHIENFGTWRDAEGRLIWGVNDFDEVSMLPYTNDLLRLATSASLAISANNLSTGVKEACLALLSGYSKTLEAGGRPFVLEEQNPELRRIAVGILRDPVHFWKKLETQMVSLKRSDLPKEALVALATMMPEPDLNFNVFARRAGQGSLGRQRFVAIADYMGGRIARETKALAPSACIWAAGSNSAEILYQKMLACAVRCKDPFVSVKGRWVVRRLAPDCSRIDLSTLPEERDERLLLTAMGSELANIHLGSPEVAHAIASDLKKRPLDWLANAAKDMVDAVDKDWKSWRDGPPKPVGTAEQQINQGKTIRKQL